MPGVSRPPRMSPLAPFARTGAISAAPVLAGGGNRPCAEAGTLLGAQASAS